MAKSGRQEMANVGARGVSPLQDLKDVFKGTNKWQ